MVFSLLFNMIIWSIYIQNNQFTCADDDDFNQRKLAWGQVLHQCP